MNSGDQLDRTGRQLQEQADRLLRLHGDEPPIAALLTEHRGRRRRRIVRCACGVAVVLTLVGLSGVLRSLRHGEPVADQHEPGGRPVVQTQDPGEEGSRVVVAPHVPPADQSPIDRAPQHVVGAAAEATGPTAWPVVITVPEGDQQRVIAHGIYVPEHTRPLKLLDLSPGQQHAVRQVLGIPQQSISRDPI